MFEVNAELIGEKVFVSIDDLIKLCDGSISDKGTPFDNALLQLKAQIVEIEHDVRANLKGVSHGVSEENLA